MTVIQFPRKGERDADILFRSGPMTTYHEPSDEGVDLRVATAVDGMSGVHIRIGDFHLDRRQAEWFAKQLLTAVRYATPVKVEDDGTEHFACAPEVN